MINYLNQNNWLFDNILYKEHVFSCMLALKYMCQFGMR